MMLKPSAAPVLYQCSSDIGDLGRRADRCAMARAPTYAGRADGLSAFRAGQGRPPRLAALLRIGQRHVGHRPVERDMPKIDADMSDSVATPTSGWISACSASYFSSASRWVEADHDNHAGHDRDMLRRAAGLRRALLDVGIVFARRLDVLLRRRISLRRFRAASSRPASD